MNATIIVVLVIIGLVGLFILWRIIKPYTLRYDTTLCIVGGLGSGKTITAVKTAVIILRRDRFIHYTCHNFFKYKIGNFFRRLHNKRIDKYNSKHTKQKQHKELYKRNLKPLLYSNIPVHFKKHIFSKKREWNTTLTASHILCFEEMVQYSVVIIDELPQFINQFNWNEELVQKNVNEWITYFRHYYAGHLLCTAQAIDDVVVQIRRKLNQATWCFNFKAYPFKFMPIFYTIRMCDIMLSDQVGTISTSFIEENTKLHFGLFPPKGTYDTRCYSERINNILYKYIPKPKHKNLKTNKILRLVKYRSPLDDTTTSDEKEAQYKKGESIWKN